jgi:hypothetical protein
MNTRIFDAGGLPALSASGAWFWGVVDALVGTEHGCAVMWRFDDFRG